MNTGNSRRMGRHRMDALFFYKMQDMYNLGH